MLEVRAPRAVFVDYPAGRTFGRPGAGDDHERILAAALGELPCFSQPQEIRDLSCQWERDGDRSWEAALREELSGPPFPEPARSALIRLQA